MAYLLKAERRGGTSLIYADYKYVKNSERKTKIHWRCWRRGKCQGKLQTNVFDINKENPRIRVLEVSVFLSFFRFIWNFLHSSLLLFWLTVFCEMKRKETKWKGGGGTLIRKPIWSKPRTLTLFIQIIKKEGSRNYFLSLKKNVGQNMSIK